MSQNARVTQPMKVSSGAYVAMAKLYREKAHEVRVMYLSREQKNRVAKMLEDAASDYEATAQDMDQS